MRKNNKTCPKKSAHLQCVNNHYAKLEYKVVNTVGATDYTNQTPLGISDGKMSKINTHQKMSNNMKHAQNKRCTSSICKV